ncbi:hypothetical protein EIP91_006987 [Steccherinum ochraceum]|uniref:Uncharacterized protein n=1 Tax=Steccherinum ochraceum TaxID=92696 RepID=A0A4R0RFD7_9APHY|nr:hypothetical protein EIP91_006987 [Steccherinum ochraceum]
MVTTRAQAKSTPSTALNAPNSGPTVPPSTSSTPTHGPRNADVDDNENSAEDEEDEEDEKCGQEGSGELYEAMQKVMQLAAVASVLQVRSTSFKLADSVESVLKCGQRNESDGLNTGSEKKENIEVEEVIPEEEEDEAEQNLSQDRISDFYDGVCHLLGWKKEMMGTPPPPQPRRKRNHQKKLPLPSFSMPLSSLPLPPSSAPPAPSSCPASSFTPPPPSSAPPASSSTPPPPSHTASPSSTPWTTNRGTRPMKNAWVEEVEDEYDILLRTRAPSPPMKHILEDWDMPSSTPSSSSGPSSSAAPSSVAGTGALRKASVEEVEDQYDAMLRVKKPRPPMKHIVEEWDASLALLPLCGKHQEAKKKRRSAAEKVRRRGWKATKVQGSRVAQAERAVELEKMFGLKLRHDRDDWYAEKVLNGLTVETKVHGESLRHESSAYCAPKFDPDTVSGTPGKEGGKSLFGDVDPNAHPEAFRLMQEEKYTYVCRPANGQATFFTDSNGVVYAARASQPTDPAYKLRHRRIFARANALMKPGVLRHHYPFTHHNRGKFWCLSYGVSHCRNPKPAEMSLGWKGNDDAIRDFMASPEVQSVTNHVMSGFQLFFPNVAAMYSLALQRLAAKDVLRNTYFKNCAFAACSVNLAEQTLADKHVDNRDFVNGICAILALGDFNPRTSAHIVLTEPRLIIELGPGDVFYFPSATIHHHSIPMRTAEETRKSMIWYSAGSLFRWVMQGHKRAKRASEMTAEEKREAKENGIKRWMQGWKLYSKISDLKGSPSM